MTVFGFAVAVSPLMPEVPPMLSVEFAPWASVPVPESAVLTVSVPLLFNVTVVTVTLGIEKVPVSVCVFVSKV